MRSAARNVAGKRAAPPNFSSRGLASARISSHDERAGPGRTTGHVTHVTAADVNAERDLLFQWLEKTGELAEWYDTDGFHKQLEGCNGGGDPWHTRVSSRHSLRR